MRGLFIALAVAMAVLWVVLRFALMVTSAFIHLLLVIAVVLLVLGLIRRATRTSGTP